MLHISTVVVRISLHSQLKKVLKYWLPFEKGLILVTIGGFLFPKKTCELYLGSIIVE